MTESEALELLEVMVAWDKVPTLTAFEVGRLVERARRVDTDGLLPSDTGWTGTYDLNWAAAEGWRWKAAKVAGDFSFSTDGQTFNRVEMVRECRAMAEMYGRRVVGSIPLALPGEWDTDIAGNINA